MIHFIGIGAQKAGTTWLYEHLRNHPDVRFPAGKEVHFWDAKLDRGEEWWLSQFPDSRKDVRQGEITPAYAILDRERIGRIHALVPELRIFYSLRNPIERAWSSALMALTRAEMTIDEASDRWFLDHFHSAGSMGRGLYSACLESWLSVFPAGQFAVVFFDDIVSQPRSVLSKICSHLGVDDGRFETQEEARLKIPVFGGTKARIRPALLSALRELYAPEIRRLSLRFERDLENWSAWNGSGA